MIRDFVITEIEPSLNAGKGGYVVNIIDDGRNIGGIW